MGLEMLLGAGVLGSAYGEVRGARKEAKAKTAEANLQAKERLKSTQISAGKQKTAFLSSGLGIEGTPLAVIENTLKTGGEDIDQIIANANMASSNIMSAGRARAVEKLGQFASMGMGGSPTSGSQGQFGDQTPARKPLYRG